MVAPTTHYLLVHGRNVSLTKDTNSSLDACWLGGVYTQPPSTTNAVYYSFGLQQNSDERSVWGRTFPPVVMSVK